MDTTPTHQQLTDLACDISATYARHAQSSWSTKLGAAAALLDDAARYAAPGSVPGDRDRRRRELDALARAVASWSHPGVDRMVGDGTAGASAGRVCAWVCALVRAVLSDRDVAGPMARVRRELGWIGQLTDENTGG